MNYDDTTDNNNNLGQAPQIRADLCNMRFRILLLDRDGVDLARSYSVPGSLSLQTL